MFNNSRFICDLLFIFSHRCLRRLAHSRVLNMHRAQGITDNRAISVVDSQSGARLNLMDLYPELSGQSAELSAGKSGVDALLDKAMTQARVEISAIRVEAESNTKTSGFTISLPEKQMPEPVPTKSYDFDMDM